jgi:hypothetical protein
MADVNFGYVRFIRIVSSLLLVFAVWLLIVGSATANQGADSHQSDGNKNEGKRY